MKLCKLGTHILEGRCELPMSFCFYVCMYSTVWTVYTSLSFLHCQWNYCSYHVSLLQGCTDAQIYRWNIYAYTGVLRIVSIPLYICFLLLFLNMFVFFTYTTLLAVFVHLICSHIYIQKTHAQNSCQNLKSNKLFY